MATSRLHQLSEQGQSVWIDFLSRPLLRDGDLERMLRDDAVVGVTSNPTIFQKAISQGDAYDEQIREVLERSEDAKEVFLELAVRDVQDACDLLGDTHERTGGVDGFVSIEVDPHLAYDRDATIAEARRLSELVDRPNVYVKIPATEPGLGAIEETIAAGIPVNVTLIFGLGRYRAVAEAYLRGLERLVESGGDAAKVPSVASFSTSSAGTTTCAAAWPSPTRASPTRPSRRSSPASAGRPCGRPARDRSAACGPRRRSRTSATATRCTSRS